jgi:hypothetical protein
MTHGKEQHGTATNTHREARASRAEAVSGLGARRGLAPGEAVHRASGEAEERQMIVHNDKQVLVTGIDHGGRNARVHPVERLGDCFWVEVGELCADTLQELEDELTAAPVVS